MKLKAILFDLDGTLLDSISVILRASEETCGLMDIPYDEVQVRNWIGVPLTVQSGLIAKDREQEFVDTYKSVYRQYHADSTKLFDGTMEMLDRLHGLGYKTALVTSKNIPGTRRVLDSSGLGCKFDIVITADDVDNPKPHPEPILKGLEAVDVSAEEAVYVGDSFFDYESAAAAGVPMIAVSWGARTREDLAKLDPAAVFDSWEEFLEWAESRREDAG
jgi:pyrophosphatase PpaX